MMPQASPLSEITDFKLTTTDFPWVNALAATWCYTAEFQRSHGGHTENLKEVETEIAKLQGIADVLRGSEGKRGKRRGTTRRKRKPMSAATRKKISLAQKARWAKTKKQS